MTWHWKNQVYGWWKRVSWWADSLFSIQRGDIIFTGRTIRNTLMEAAGIYARGICGQAVIKNALLLNSPILYGQFTYYGTGLKANQVFGNHRYSICLNKDSETGLYCPNSLLNKDIRVTSSSARKIFFVFIKEFDDEAYSTCIYSAKGFDLSILRMDCFQKLWKKLDLENIKQVRLKWRQSCFLSTWQLLENGVKSDVRRRRGLVSRHHIQRGDHLVRDFHVPESWTGLGVSAWKRSVDFPALTERRVSILLGQPERRCGQTEANQGGTAELIRSFGPLSRDRHRTGWLFLFHH